MHDLNFVINGKGISLHSDFNYVKRSKIFFPMISAQNMRHVQL